MGPRAPPPVLRPLTFLSMRSPFVRFVFLTSLVATLAAGCSSTTDSSAPVDSAPTGESLDWLEPSPDLANRMDQRMEQIPWTQGMEDRVEMIQWWAERGETAYSRLLELAADPRPDVSDLAFAALAASRDSRLVEPMRTIPWPPEDQVDSRYSRARAHLVLGDWAHVNVLIEGLEDDRLFARGLCFKTLKGATRQDLGYSPLGTEEERAEAAKRWRVWSEERSGDPMLGAEPASQG